MLLLLDNYDSFTFNLAQYFMELGEEVRVVRNDELSVEEALALKPDRVCISPGPGRPSGAGITLELIAACAGKAPLLGVCLGHQAIAEHFGGKVVHAPTLMHGKTSRIVHEGEGVFKGLPSPFTATRYHSLAVEPESVPDCLEVTARTEDGPSTGSGQGVIMGLRHKELTIEGVQFHPEAILTEHGHALLRNWLVASPSRR
ncbi:MAG: aminodeoxychorismate/anthranilate synthase component II [Planctomycetes bacterium]|nr:aminodeoxychorismate/anthranilate synthase component II [Planctomycetota bacterium]